MKKTKITTVLIKQEAHTFDLQAVFHLSLTNQEFRRLDSSLNMCTDLLSLDVSNNKINDLAPLDGSKLPLLKTLNLSRNEITHLSALKPLPSLLHLFLEGNRIETTDDLMCLTTKLPSLQTLHLQELGGKTANPVCAEPGYRDRILQLFPTLKVLDGQRLHTKFDLGAVEREVLSRAQKQTEEKVLDPETFLRPFEHWISDDTLIRGGRADDDDREDGDLVGIRDTLGECRDLDAECTEMIRRAEELVAAAAAGPEVDLEGVTEGS